MKTSRHILTDSVLLCTYRDWTRGFREKKSLTMNYLFAAGFFKVLWVQRLVCLTACYMQILQRVCCVQSEERAARVLLSQIGQRS